MDFVLDASVALSWCFADESSPETTELLNTLATQGAFVPAIWPLELGNILVSAEKRGRLTRAKAMQFLELISALNIQIDGETAQHAFHDTLSLAYSEKLTTYDASYLELAMRMGLPLATKDQDLSAAATRLGVKLIAV